MSNVQHTWEVIPQLVNFTSLLFFLFGKEKLKCHESGNKKAKNQTAANRVVVTDGQEWKPFCLHHIRSFLTCHGWLFPWRHIWRFPQKSAGFSPSHYPNLNGPTRGTHSVITATFWILNMHQNNSWLHMLWVHFVKKHTDAICSAMNESRQTWRKQDSSSDVHTYGDCSVHHHSADGEHQQRDGESNTGILCVGETWRLWAAGWERKHPFSSARFTLKGCLWGALNLQAADYCESAVS